MLSFLILDDDRPATDRSLRQTYLVGPDSVPVAGEVHFEDGLIHCVKTTAEAAGVATQVDLDEPTIRELADIADADDPELVLRPLGSLILRTCLLPERNRPYLLSLELARHQLMLLLNKLEEWQLFDLPPTDPIMRLFEGARSSFTESLVAQRFESDESTHGFGVRSHRLALRALWLAVEAGERLALRDASVRFRDRHSGAMYDAAVEAASGAPTQGPRSTAPVINHARAGVVLPTPPAIGCVASPASFGEPAQQAARRACEFITVPMRWIDLEPSEGEYAYTPTDRWIEWAVRVGRVPVVAGPVIDFGPEAVPEWLYIWENDYETLRELVYEHMKAVVTRYRRTIARWTVASGLHVNANFKLSFEQMMDLTRICVLVVRKLHPTAKVQVEITQPWGEYYTHDRRSLPPMLYAEMLAQAGIHVDAVSLRLPMGTPTPGAGTRDLLTLSALLDQYATLERPLSVSAVAVPSAVPTTPPDQPELSPGWWRSPWNEQTQADWTSAALAIALAKPYVESVCWAGLMDARGALTPPSTGLITTTGAPRPVLERLVELRSAMVAGSAPARLTNESVLQPAGAHAET